MCIMSHWASNRPRNWRARRNRWPGLVLVTAAVLAVAACDNPTGSDAAGGGATPPENVILVDASATGNEDGSSWSNAFRYLQDALAVATSGNEIWMADGTYYPDEGDGMADDDRTASFVLRDTVSIYGGFAGGETSRNERDPA